MQVTGDMHAMNGRERDKLGLREHSLKIYLHLQKGFTRCIHLILLDCCVATVARQEYCCVLSNNIHIPLYSTLIFSDPSV